MSKLVLVEGKDVPYAITQEGQKIQRFFPGDDGGQYMCITWQVPREVKAHYHPTDQFQVVLEGEATFPDHKLVPLDVHYSDSKTPYGPFDVGPEGITMGLLRRRKVGFIDMDAPPSYGADANKDGLEFYCLTHDTQWESLSQGLRRKVTGARDGRGPDVQIFEGKEGALIQTGTAPHGEYVIFYKGTFKTGGRTIESISVRYAESEDPTPAITCMTDGATVISAKYYRPILASEPSKLLAGETIIQ